METKLEGRVALVTGAGRGIGRAIVLDLVRAGCRVAVTDIDLEAAKETERLAGEKRGWVSSHRLDVVDRGQFAEVVEEVERGLGPIDILVNNAGIMLLGPFLDHTAAQDRSQIEINLLGVIHGMRAVLPGMKARNRGHVVNVASVAGRIGAPHAAIYSATKFGVIGLTESVRVEMWKTPIRFTYVMPALVQTELISGAGRPRWPPVVQAETVAKAVVEAIQKKRLRVYVPRTSVLSSLLPAVLPQRVVDLVGRALRVDKMFAAINRRERAGYARRAGEPEEPPEKPRS